jgi:quercetin dioxygenase-like cupin family protein
MSAETGMFVHTDNDWQNIGPGIRRKLLGYDAALMMVVVEFEAGAVGALHEHPHRQATYVAEGEFEITIAGDKQNLRAGDGFFVPSGANHGAVALTAGTLVDVFAPAREDFVK